MLQILQNVQKVIKFANFENPMEESEQVASRKGEGEEVSAYKSGPGARRTREEQTRGYSPASPALRLAAYGCQRLELLAEPQVTTGAFLQHFLKAECRTELRQQT